MSDSELQQIIDRARSEFRQRLLSASPLILDVGDRECTAENPIVEVVSPEYVRDLASLLPTSAETQHILTSLPVDDLVREVNRQAMADSDIEAFIVTDCALDAVYRGEIHRVIWRSRMSGYYLFKPQMREWSPLEISREGFVENFLKVPNTLGHRPEQLLIVLSHAALELLQEVMDANPDEWGDDTAKRLTSDDARLFGIPVVTESSGKKLPFIRLNYPDGSSKHFLLRDPNNQQAPDWQDMSTQVTNYDRELETFRQSLEQHLQNLLTVGSGRKSLQHPEAAVKSTVVYQRQYPSDLVDRRDGAVMQETASALADEVQEHAANQQPNCPHAFGAVYVMATRSTNLTVQVTADVWYAESTEADDAGDEPQKAVVPQFVKDEEELREYDLPATAAIPPVSFEQLEVGDYFTAHPCHHYYGESNYGRTLRKVDDHYAESDGESVAIIGDEEVWQRVPPPAGRAIPPVSLKQLEVGEYFTAHPCHPYYGWKGYDRTLRKVDDIHVRVDGKTVLMVDDGSEVWERVPPPGARTITTHQVNQLNQAIHLEAKDTPGPGGANNHYRILLVGEHQGRQGECSWSDLDIHFQNGAVKSAGINGISNEVLLAILIDRLEGFQEGSWPSHENQVALDHLQTARLWLYKRTLDREMAWGC